MLPHRSSLLFKWGKESWGGSGETSPYPRCFPASFPASSVTFCASVVVTLGERVTSVGAPLNRGGDRVSTQQGGRRLCTADNATVRP
jgi:hypothetical protein